MVAGGLAGDAVGKANGDDVIVHALHRVGGQSGLGDILHGLALPIGQILEDQLPVLRGDIVGVFGADGELVQLVQIELGAGLELRMQVGAAILVGGGAHDQLIVHDEGGHVLGDVAHHLGAEDGHRLAGELLVGLRGQHQALRRNAGAGVKQLIAHTGKTFI